MSLSLELKVVKLPSPVMTSFNVTCDTLNIEIALRHESQTLFQFLSADFVLGK